MAYDQAVEAAVEALYPILERHGVPYNRFEVYARTAVEAAAPFICPPDHLHFSIEFETKEEKCDP